jgi:4'-phosphopantetheinyl transferase
MIKPEQEKTITENPFIHPDAYLWKLGNAVQVWKFPAIPTALALLTSSEKIIAGRFRFESDRNRFVVGRQALRFLLSKYLSVNPLDISILAERGQKPFIGNTSSGIHFNISHSGEWVLIALGRHELGIDLEKINPEFDFDKLLENHFSEAEQTFIYAAADQVAAFYFLWTRKEALTKAWGTGLQESLKEVPALNADSSLNQQQKSWKLESFHLSALYPAALAYSWEMENPIYFDGTASFKNFIGL